LKLMRDGRPVTVEVTSDGAGLVSHAGTALLAQVADKVGLTGALSLRLSALKQRRRGHDPGRVIRDLAVKLAGGGECVSDLGAVRDQDALLGAVASDSTAFRVIDRVASEPGLLEALRLAHARARARFWELHGAPERLTIDIDATLITAHSEKEKAAGNYKCGYGFHPLQAYADETREALGGLLGGLLRPGNAGSNTAADHQTVLDLALVQIPAQYIEDLEILVRADSAGATHGLLDYCREGNMRFSVGYELTEPVRAAILEIPDDAWVPALDQDGSVRTNGEVAEITDRVDLSSWPEGSRLIVRRERPHPGAPLSFTDHDGYHKYSLLKRGAERDVLPLCEQLGLGFVPYFPLASGLLTGKYRRGAQAPAGARLSGRDRLATDAQFDLLEALDRYAQDRGLTMTDVAIGALLAQPAVCSVIAGATKPEQVRSNASAARWNPSEEDLAALAELLG
jgi:Transposase DDE domain group 1/Aldo/keto reductase family